jgi:hypothetical protein
MVEKKRRQGQKGANPKQICPKCEKEYLKTAWSTENRKWKRIGQFCPNPACDYLMKDFVELKDTEEETGTQGLEECESLRKPGMFTRS